MCFCAVPVPTSPSEAQSCRTPVRYVRSGLPEVFVGCQCLVVSRCIPTRCFVFDWKMLSKRTNLNRISSYIETANRILCRRKQSTNIVRSPVADLKLSQCPLHEYVWARLDKWHDKTALVRANKCIKCIPLFKIIMLK